MTSPARTSATPTAIRAGHRAHTLAALAGVAVLSACAGSPPARVPPAAGPEAAPERAQAALSFTYGAGTFRYAMQGQVVVELLDQSPPQRDSIATDAAMTVTLPVAGDSGVLALTGTLDSLVSRSILRSPGTVTLPAPLHFLRHADLREGITNITLLDPAAGCDPDSIAPLSLVTDLLPPLSAAFAGAAGADDSLVTSSCRGVVPVTTRVSYHYLPPEWVATNDGSRIHLRRDSHVRLDGTTSRAGRTISVQGEGESTSDYLLDPARGVLVEERRSFTLTLSLQTGATSRRFTQRGEFRLTLR